MKTCIIGTGVSGLMTDIELNKLSFVESLQIIGSKNISPVVAGESTTIV